jgi:hypothetical protein
MFRPEEGRMGVTVTFIAILELMREGLVEIVQAEPYAPIHLRASAEKRNLRLVANNETPEQVAHAAELGETVLEEVAAERVEAEAEATALDAGFVDDDDDVEPEEVVEDFGVDNIVVPEVNFGRPPPDWKPAQVERPPGDDAGIEALDVADVVTEEAAIAEASGVGTSAEAEVAAADVAMDVPAGDVAAGEIEFEARPPAEKAEGDEDQAEQVEKGTPPDEGRS